MVQLYETASYLMSQVSVLITRFCLFGKRSFCVHKKSNQTFNSKTNANTHNIFGIILKLQNDYSTIHVRRLVQALNNNHHIKMWCHYRQFTRLLWLNWICNKQKTLRENTRINAPTSGCSVVFLKGWRFLRSFFVFVAFSDRPSIHSPSWKFWLFTFLKIKNTTHSKS